MQWNGNITEINILFCFSNLFSREIAVMESNKPKEVGKIDRRPQWEIERDNRKAEEKMKMEAKAKAAEKERQQQLIKERNEAAAAAAAKQRNHGKLETNNNVYN